MILQTIAFLYTGAVASENVCLYDGIFPDLTDCKKFFVCTPDDAGGFYNDEYECDDGYVFDPTAIDGNFCRYTMNRDCVTLDCNGLTGNFLVTYPDFQGQIGGSCRKDQQKPIPFSCEGNFDADLNIFPVECKFAKCREEGGKYEYIEDNTKYIECVYNFDLDLVETKLKSCFSNYYFNNNLGQCVRIDS